MVRLPGQSVGSIFAPQLSATVTKDLIIELLRGSIRRPQDVTDWLAMRAGTNPNNKTEHSSHWSTSEVH